MCIFCFIVTTFVEVTDIFLEVHRFKNSSRISGNIPAAFSPNICGRNLSFSSQKRSTLFVQTEQNVDKVRWGTHTSLLDSFSQQILFMSGRSDY